MKRVVGRFANRRGATIVIVALSTAAILAMGAISVDVAMLFKMRGEAQRTADAAALAGASAYLEFPKPVDARSLARERALKYVEANYIGAITVDVDSSEGGTTETGTKWVVQTKEAVVVILPDSEKVRVIVRRQGIGMLFGRALTPNTSTVSAMAAARTVNAGGAKCVKPFALPDIWGDVDDDANGNRQWDEGEEWSFEPDVDHYSPYKLPDGYTAPETGYGSDYRNGYPDASGYQYTGDKGRQIKIKPTDPNDTGVISPGIFYPWVMPEDPNQEAECGIGGKGGDQGASAYSQNICTCNDSEVYLDTEYEIKTGNMVGPTHFGIEDLIALDPDAYWDPVTNSVKGSDWGNWLDSPRVIKIALWDPIEVQKSGKQSIKFTNISLMFVEEQEKMKDPVTARFITYAQGTGPGPKAGPLVKILQLVE
jgi:hypothetical protein